MRVLFLSHCVPNPPDKGEKIRAHHVVMELARHFEVHLVAFARGPGDLEAARALESRCASVRVAVLSSRWALLRAGLQFAAGKSLMMSYYGGAALHAQVAEAVRSAPPDVTVAFSGAMAQYAPEGTPLVLDMTDVDSEKWLDYGKLRFGGPLYRMEGRRLREQEIRYANRAHCTFLATDAERALLSGIVPSADVRAFENGVALDYFDPARVLAEHRGRPYLAFVGVMDYFPNVDGVCWFAREVMPDVRRNSDLQEFVVVGRNPAPAVRRLHGADGVTVTGSVADVRPYLAGASAVVAPLRLARGIQNKVLEALAMNKVVFASREVCRTFGERVPAGVVACGSANEFAAAIARWRNEPETALDIRGAAAGRFRWDRQVDKLAEAIRSASGWRQ
ncbi:MAG: TIGR03087 family PEP-CTERM/XrtA system glycosyltransferase [Bryobacteraceae bacterium]|nr:TIGR03087 family PEP-CTERM/XrtA system glycosyltransferase [Bryobacteraceae bacterium]